MSDIVERLRWSGQDAMTKHLSLGMHTLHTEAAAEIERLNELIAKGREINAEWLAENEHLRARVLALETALTTIALGDVDGGGVRRMRLDSMLIARITLWPGEESA